MECKEPGSNNARGGESQKLSAKSVWLWILFFFPFSPQILPLDSFFYDPLISLLFPSNDAYSEDGNVVCVCVLEEGAGFMSHNRHLRHFIPLNSKCSKGALCSFEE